MSKTIVVIGAGPGIGLAIGRQWGSHGYSVALVARQPARMARFVDQLEVEGIAASAHPTDATDLASLRATLGAIEEQHGTIDALYFGPPPTAGTMCAPRDITVERLASMVDLLNSAVTAVQHVLPGMIDRGEGALLFSMPMSAIDPVLFSANYAMACAAIRNYAQSLYVDVAPHGVHVGVVPIAGLVVEGDPEPNTSPDANAGRRGAPRVDDYRSLHEDRAAPITAERVAAAFWDLASTRDPYEQIVGDPEICSRLRAQALAGTSAT